MRIVLKADPLPSEGSAPAYLTKRRMDLNKFDQFLDLIGSEYDEQEPYQDRDANGLLWLDKDGNTLTQVQVDAAILAAEDPKIRVVFAPKYRARTRSEVWNLILDKILFGLTNTAKRRFKILQERVENPPPTLNFSEDL